MAQKLTVTVPDWVERDVVNKNPYKNKSEWIAELLIKGKKAYDYECDLWDYIPQPNNSTQDIYKAYGAELEQLIATQPSSNMQTLQHQTMMGVC